MRRYLVLALAAIALAIAAPSAFATRVIFDPPLAQTCTQNTPCNIIALNQPYHVDFLACSDVHGVDTLGNNWCLWLNNVTSHQPTKFTFAFNIPAGGSDSDNDGLVCSSNPASLATNNCPDALPTAGGLFTVSFFTNQPFPNATDFYLFTDFVNSPGTATVTVSVPEPGQLGLFGLGLLVLGAGFGWQRRRLASRSKGAA